MKRVRVRLVHEHTHQGVAHSPGAVLELIQRDADWLMTLGVAVAAHSPAGDAEFAEFNDEREEGA